MRGMPRGTFCACVQHIHTHTHLRQIDLIEQVSATQERQHAAQVTQLGFRAPTLARAQAVLLIRHAADCKACCRCIGYGRAGVT